MQVLLLAQRQAVCYKPAHHNLPFLPHFRSLAQVQQRRGPISMIKEVLSRLITYPQMNHLMPHSDLLSEDFPRLSLIHLHSLICLLFLLNLLAFQKGRGEGKNSHQLQEACSCLIKLFFPLQKLLEISWGFSLAAPNHYNLTDSVITCLTWKWLDCCFFVQSISALNDS